MKEKTLNSKIVYDGKILKVRKDEVLVSNNAVSQREYINHAKVVAVLPIIDDKILLIKQYRYVVDKIMYEIPAGRVDFNEEIIVAAKRELQEETGYKTDNLNSLGHIYPSAGYTDEIIHLFYSDSNLIKGETNFDFDEVIEAELKTVKEVLEMIDTGVIDDPKTIIAIYKYLRLKNIIILSE